MAGPGRSLAPSLTADAALRVCGQAMVPPAAPSGQRWWAPPSPLLRALHNGRGPSCSCWAAAVTASLGLWCGFVLLLAVSAQSAGPSAAAVLLWAGAAASPATPSSAAPGRPSSTVRSSRSSWSSSSSKPQPYHASAARPDRAAPGAMQAPTRYSLPVRGCLWVSSGAGLPLSSGSTGGVWLA